MAITSVSISKWHNDHSPEFYEMQDKIRSIERWICPLLQCSFDQMAGTTDWHPKTYPGVGLT